MAVLPVFLTLEATDGVDYSGLLNPRDRRCFLQNGIVGENRERNAEILVIVKSWFD